MKKPLFVILIFFIPAFSFSLVSQKSSSEGVSSRVSAKKNKVAPKSQKAVKLKPAELKAPKRKTAADPIFFQKGENQRSNKKKYALLKKEPYEPRVSKEVLDSRFVEHLKAFKANCGLPPAERRPELEKKIQKLTQFLTESLKDPYMDYEHALLFGDILGLMENKILETPSGFNTAYKLLYNVEETTQPQEYEHDWAKVIYESIKCSNWGLWSLV